MLDWNVGFLRLVSIAAMLMSTLANAQEAWCPTQASLDDVAGTNNGNLAIDLLKKFGVLVGGSTEERVNAVIARSPNAESLLPKLMIFSTLCNLTLADATKSPPQKKRAIMDDWDEISKAATAP